MSQIAIKSPVSSPSTAPPASKAPASGTTAAKSEGSAEPSGSAAASASAAAAKSKVSISAAAVAAMKELRETPAQTQAEARSGDAVARRLVAKAQARAAQYQANSK